MEILMFPIPPFLQLLEPASVPNLPYCRTIFYHQPPLSPTFTLWWPCKSTDSPPNVIILFVPGNPGLVELYIPFLSAIKEMDASERIAIFAQAHIGHTPGIIGEVEDQGSGYLSGQVQIAIEAFDALKVTFPNARIVLVGHSVGSWISLQVLRVRNDVAGVFLLFPTISRIASTPHGRSLSWSFRHPMPSIISRLAGVLRLVPNAVLPILFPSWPKPQLLVLQKFLHSPSSIYASLCMAHDEMGAIQDLDEHLLNANGHRLWVFFAEKDGWVGEQREKILEAFPDTENARVVHGSSRIPHAFSINHSDALAVQCYEWLQFL